MFYGLYRSYNTTDCGKRLFLLEYMYDKQVNLSDLPMAFSPVTP